jgi:phosphate transport system protein
MKISQESHSTHISQKFNEELEEIRSQLLEMGGLVEQQIHDAIQSLVDGDTRLASEVRKKDK